MAPKSVPNEVKKVAQKQYEHETASRRLQGLSGTRGPADQGPGEGGWGMGDQEKKRSAGHLDHPQPRGLVGLVCATCFMKAWQ